MAGRRSPPAGARERAAHGAGAPRGERGAALPRRRRRARAGALGAARDRACATIGLAPFVPEPHVVEKLRWLATGQPFRPIDLFDLLMHGAPWLWLGWTAARALRRPR